MSDHDTTPGAPETEALAWTLADDERKYPDRDRITLARLIVNHIHETGRVSIAVAQETNDASDEWVYRMLATRDAAQRAAGAETALREAAAALNSEGLDFKDDAWSISDQPVLDALTKTMTWLRERADRIGATLPGTDGCASCTEGDPGNECPKSERPCGHHCNHIWESDHCDWCGYDSPGDEGENQ